MALPRGPAGRNQHGAQRNHQRTSLGDQAPVDPLLLPSPRVGLFRLPLQLGLRLSALALVAGPAYHRNEAIVDQLQAGSVCVLDDPKQPMAGTREGLELLGRDQAALEGLALRVGPTIAVALHEVLFDEHRGVGRALDVVCVEGFAVEVTEDVLARRGDERLVDLPVAAAKVQLLTEQAEQRWLDDRVVPITRRRGRVAPPDEIRYQRRRALLEHGGPRLLDGRDCALARHRAEPQAVAQQ